MILYLLSEFGILSLFLFSQIIDLDQMTAQIGDRIFIDNNEYTLACEPLSSYLYDNKVEKLFTAVNTACYRGYCAKWGINNGKIYLTDIESPCQIRSRNEIDSDEPISAIQKLFPGQTEVFAVWINGTLKIQSGELLEYVHIGYESLYETNIYLKFENGVLIEEKTVDNTPKE
jgi:hypothetical protein